MEISIYKARLNEWDAMVVQLTEARQREEDCKKENNRLRKLKVRSIEDKERIKAGEDRIWQLSARNG